MKIVYVIPNNMERYTILNGWVNVLQKYGHKCIPWNNKQKTAFDVFDEEDVDMILMFVNNYTEDIYKCLEERPFVRTVFFADSFFSTNENAKDLLLKSQEWGCPEILCTKYESGIEYDTLKNKIISPPAVDKYIHIDGQSTNFIQSDIAFIGPCPKEHENIIYNICKNTELNIKIFDNVVWDVPQYIGKVQYEFIKYILPSAKMVLCPSYNDIIPSTLMYDNICITLYPNMFEEFGAINKDKITDIFECLNNKEYRVRPKPIISQHTYNHRVKVALDKLGIE